ncbi:MAG: serine/threonine-protein phosphatase [Acidobacteria bacterium]|nr:serine/threonine-protein phosphatase [Acidobacteriota bacterium]
MAVRNLNLDLNHVTAFALSQSGKERRHHDAAFVIADLDSGDLAQSDESQNLLTTRHGALFAIAEGLGGEASGEVASELAMTFLSATLMNLPLFLEPSERLRMAVEKANEKIWRCAQHSILLTGMGTTLTALLIHEQSACLAQVGDSRAYLIRRNRLTQLTREQSLAQLLRDAGAVEVEDDAAIPADILVQALGVQPKVTPTLINVELGEDDQLLLCSDALADKVRDEEMQQIVEQADEVSSACQQLMELAQERGGGDNLTVLLVRLDAPAQSFAESLAQADDLKLVRSRHHAAPESQTHTQALKAEPQAVA